MSFSIIQRLISDSPEPASPVNNGEPLKIIAIRLPFSSCFILDIKCCRNKREPSDILGSPAPNLPLYPSFSYSSRINFSAFFHSTPKGGLVSMYLKVLPLCPSSVKLSPKMMLSAFCPFISMSDLQMLKDWGFISCPNNSTCIPGFNSFRYCSATESIPPVPAQQS